MLDRVLHAPLKVILTVKFEFSFQECHHSSVGAATMPALLRESTSGNVICQLIVNSF